MRPASCLDTDLCVTFQLTHPSRGATQRKIRYLNPKYISTHTPLAGCDFGVKDITSAEMHFNSHTPRGVRQKSASCWQLVDEDFNSHTPRGVRHTIRVSPYYKKIISTHTPLAGCDSGLFLLGIIRIISTHTPLAGCDVSIGARGCRSGDFNSHTPRGVRLMYPFAFVFRQSISTHTPLAGCD